MIDTNWNFISRMNGAW